MTPHHITSSLCLFLSFPRFYVCMGITLASCIWNFAKIILGCINYFHNYVSEFMKKIPFSPVGRIVTRVPNCTCRQVKISFLGMPQIAHYQVEKWKSSLPWEGGHPPPTPSRAPLGHYAPSGLVASLPRKKLCPPPQMFWLITPLAARICQRGPKRRSEATERGRVWEGDFHPPAKEARFSKFRVGKRYFLAH